MKFYRLSLIILFLLLSGCATPPDPLSDLSANDQVLAPPRQEDGQVIAAANAAGWPSLPALMSKDLIGSDFQVGRVLDSNSAYTRYYITYRSDGLRISGIMNVPKGSGPFPLLILNHGHIDTAIYTNGRGLKREQDYLARRGYVVVHTDYRNHADSDDDPDSETDFRLGYAADAINAVQAVRAAQLPYVNAERVGMLGHSMGGGVTLNSLIVRPDLVDAAVLFAPVSADYRRNYERWMARRPEFVAELEERYGPLDAEAPIWDAISAKNYLDRIQTPIQNHHGTADESVDIAWSDELEGWLRTASKDLEYLKYPGEPHEFTDAWPLVMRRTADFFDKYLKDN